MFIWAVDKYARDRAAHRFMNRWGGHVPKVLLLGFGFFASLYDYADTGALRSFGPLLGMVAMGVVLHRMLRWIEWRDPGFSMWYLSRFRR
ncbi:hypothetical protein HYW17_03060 [Candidatus Uhrbacteria bacterium]|nr:hypothetical protein [Candidatus Uhrbacteria bacterium]